MYIKNSGPVDQEQGSAWRNLLDSATSDEKDMHPADFLSMSSEPPISRM